MALQRDSALCRAAQLRWLQALLSYFQRMRAIAPATRNVRAGSSLEPRDDAGIQEDASKDQGSTPRKTRRLRFVRRSACATFSGFTLQVINCQFELESKTIDCITSRSVSHSQQRCGDNLTGR
jgi:hypothetical protein